MPEEKKTEPKSKQFKTTSRGIFIQLLVQDSNQKKLSKLALDIGLFLNSLGSSKQMSGRFFYRSMDAVADKVTSFSGRTVTPKNNSVSEALTMLNKAGLIRYFKSIPKGIKKHGDRKGIVIELLSFSEYKNMLSERNRS